MPPSDRFRLYFAHCLGAVLAQDTQDRKTPEELASRASRVAMAALIEEEQRFPSATAGAGPALATAPRPTAAPQQVVARPPPPQIAPQAPQVAPVGAFASLAPSGAPPGSTVAANGLVQPPAGSIPGWHGDPSATPVPFPPPQADGTPTVVKMPTANAVNTRPLDADSVCPSCRALRREPSATGDVTCSYMHYEPYGRLPAPTGTPGAPTMSTGSG